MELQRTSAYNSPDRMARTRMPIPTSTISSLPLKGGRLRLIIRASAARPGIRPSRTAPAICKSQHFGAIPRDGDRLIASRATASYALQVPRDADSPRLQVPADCPRCPSHSSDRASAIGTLLFHRPGVGNSNPCPSLRHDHSQDYDHTTDDLNRSKALPKDQHPATRGKY